MALSSYDDEIVLVAGVPVRVTGPLVPLRPGEAVCYIETSPGVAGRVLDAGGGAATRDGLWYVDVLGQTA